MAFPSGLAGELKCHVGEPVHIGLAALANLHKLEVAANHLVVGGVPIPELDDLTVLPNLKGAHGLVRVEVALARLALHHLVGAVGQGAGVCLGDAIHHLDGGAHLTRGVESTVDVHRVDTLVGDLKKCPIQRGPAQGGQQAGFQVAFLNQDAASYNFVRHGKFVNDAVIGDVHGLVGGP